MIMRVTFRVSEPKVVVRCVVKLGLSYYSSSKHFMVQLVMVGQIVQCEFLLYLIHTGAEGMVNLRLHSKNKIKITFARNLCQAVALGVP